MQERHEFLLKCHTCVMLPLILDVAAHGFLI